MSSQQPSHGVGQLVLSSSPYSSTPRFTTCYFTYPLKIIVPAVTPSIQGLGAAYLLNYGGGLLDGDCVELDIKIGEECRAVLLSLGSTKVYKKSSHIAHDETPGSRQHYTIALDGNAALFLLPESVTPFASASYSQYQRVTLAKDASLCLLDWLHAGRLSRDERWAFDQYRSWTEVMVDAEIIVREMIDLTRQTGTDEASLARRMYNHTTLATLILIGAVMQPLINAFEDEWDRLEIRQKGASQAKDLEMIWSISPITTLSQTHGVIVRLAGPSTDSVRDFLGRVMRAGGLVQLIGRDLTKQVFPE